MVDLRIVVLLTFSQLFMMSGAKLGANVKSMLKLRLLNIQKRQRTGESYIGKNIAMRYFGYHSRYIRYCDSQNGTNIPKRDSNRQR
jgi:hypothetical protein